MRIVLAAFAALVLMAAEARAEVLIRVDKTSQRMAVIVDGKIQHYWIVSTGLGGGPPSGQYRPQRLERTWYSRLFNNAPMPYSIFFHGHYAIHGTNKIALLGRRASKGCVRLHPGNAAVLFALVQKQGAGRTRIVIGSGFAGRLGLRGRLASAN